MWLELLGLLVLGFAYFYYTMTKNFKHWTKMGVPQDDGKFPFGSIMGEIASRKRPIGDIMRDQYDKFRGEPYYGGYMFSKPILNINDPELIKAIMVKDFNIFVDRTGANVEKNFEHSTETDKLWVKQLTALWFLMILIGV